MGAVMVASTLWIAEGTTPDWTAAEKALGEFTCPAEGFPKNSELSGTQLEERILEDYEAEAPSTDQQRKEIVDAILIECLTTVKSLVGGELVEVACVSYAGWTVYFTGGLTHGDSIEEVDAIDLLEGTGVLEAGGFFKKPEKVMAVVLESEHDTSVELVADAATAERKVAAFCRDFWVKVVDTDQHPHAPESDEETIELFFEQANGSWWEKRTWVSTDQVAI